MHLETYSDKLSDMLDKNQNADDKAREKFTKEVKEYKQMVLQKDGEVVELNRKLEELTHTVREKCEWKIFYFVLLFIVGGGYRSRFKVVASLRFHHFSAYQKSKLSKFVRGEHMRNSFDFNQLWNER